MGFDNIMVMLNRKRCGTQRWIAAQMRAKTLDKFRGTRLNKNGALVARYWYAVATSAKRPAS
jgi:hypothetical protein